MLPPISPVLCLSVFMLTILSASAIHLCLTNTDCLCLANITHLHNIRHQSTLPWQCHLSQPCQHLKICASINMNTPTSLLCLFSTFFTCFQPSLHFWPSLHILTHSGTWPLPPQEPLWSHSNLDPQRTQDSSRSHLYDPVRPCIQLYWPLSRPVYNFSNHCMVMGMGTLCPYWHCLYMAVSHIWDSAQP